MEFIFFAAVCSVLVSIFLKITKQKKYDPMQMIAWNYAIASILCFFWFEPDLTQLSLSKTPWWLITLLGLCLPVVFLFLSKSLDRAGILKTEIAQRLSLVLSLIAAYFLFGEQFTFLKIWGVLLGLVSIAMIVLSKHGSQQLGQTKHEIPYLMAVWIGYALIDILLKYKTSLGIQFGLSLNLMFIFAFVVSILYLSVKRVHWTVGNLFAGMLLGILNFANIALYVNAHVTLKDSPAIVFAGMNILVVIFGVVAGLSLFKEKINIWIGLGIVTGLFAVMSLSMTI